MRKIKNVLKYILILLLVITPFSISMVKADSGWDTDYDSGGSSWDSGGSSYDSGSSWSSSDYDSGSSSGGSMSGTEAFITLVIFLAIFILVIALSRRQGKSNTIITNPNVNYIGNYADVSEDKIKQLMPDMTLSQLKTMAYNKFIDIQNAWMEFEYDKLRELCTDELYNSYVAQLDVLKLKNGKNIMSNFVVNGTRIIDVIEEDDKVTVKVFMNVSFFDYVINTTNNKFTRGNKNVKVINNYIMTFVRSKNVSSQMITCPNCGASNQLVTSGKCEYCGSTLVADANDFVLSKKTNVNK